MFRTSSKSRFVYIAAILFFFALTARAQQDPDQLKGFTPGGVYQFFDLDNVNLFSGNLVLTIPIGNAYPVASGFSYQFQLVCNGMVWDSEVAEGLCAPQIADPTTGNCTPISALPDRRANAGMGCTLSLGRLYPPQHVTTSRASMRWAYESPDAAEHFFESNPDGYSYTTDGTYIRMRVAGAQRWIEFPDGMIHKFAPSGDPDHDVWNLVEITNQFPSNWLRVDYSTPNTWEVSDNHGRNHTISFIMRDRDVTPTQVVKDIQLTAAGTAGAVQSQIGSNGRVKYTFDYNDPLEPLAVPYWDTDDDGRILSNDTIHAPLLKKITRPDGTTFELDHLNNSTLGTTGLIQRMRLPTRGCIAWDWQWWSKPAPDQTENLELNPHGAPGIRRRVISDRNCPDPATGTGLGVWTYDAEVTYESPQYPRTDVDREMKVTVRDPLGHSTVHYFSVAPIDLEDGWRAAEYGAPFTHKDTLPDGGLLSKEIFDCPRDSATRACIPGSTQTGLRLRREYVQYESDDGLPVFFVRGDYRRSNNRLKTTRTIFDDDGAKSLLTTNTDFNGFQYETTWRQGFGEDEIRTTQTKYQHLIDSSHWLLQPMEWKTVSENGVTRKTEYLYANDGTVTGVRTLSGNCQSMNGLCGDDLLTRFLYDTAGNADVQKSFGGDGANLQVLDCCSESGTAGYITRNRYNSGVLTASEALDPATCVNPKTCPYFLKLTDLTIDAASGLVTQTRDAAGFWTNYEYDAFGRVIAQRPIGRAWTQAVYTPPTASGPATVTIATYNEHDLPTNGALTRTRYVFDDVGRPITEFVMMADGSESRRDTTFNILGWKTAVSELGAQPTLPSTRTTFDAFGRPLSVIAPDNATTKLTYTGASTTIRQSSIATPMSDTTISTTEHYDASGRLIDISEQSGHTKAESPLGAYVKTKYSYDVDDHLTKVESNFGVANTTPQTRTFQYDGRGFLRLETHPESGTTAYTYDSRGHVVHKDAAGSAFDLDFTLDKAERVVAVRDASRVLKTFDFGGPLAGRLWKATRWNHPRTGTNDPIIRVREVYGYNDTAGRLTDRKTYITSVTSTSDTEIGTDVVSPIKQSVRYDDLNQDKDVIYPTCDPCNNFMDYQRTVTSTFQHGRVFSVAGFITSTTYAENGAWAERLHTNGVLDKQSLDPNLMQRPREIAAYGVTSCPTITEQPHDVSIVSGGTAVFSIASSDPQATFQWYTGVAPNGVAIEGATSSTLTVTNVTATTTYYCVVTAAAGNGTCQATSVPVRASVCGALAVLTEEATGDTVIGMDVPMIASVTASSSMVTYAWRLVHLADPANGTLNAPLDIGNGSAASVMPPKPGTWGLQVTVNGVCGGSTTSRTLLVKRYVVQDSAPACEVKLLTSFPPSIRLPLSHPTVYLDVTAEGTGYTYQWTVDGKARGTGPSLAASVDSGITVELTVNRTCGTTRAKTVTKTTFVYKPDNCPIPPVTIDRQLIDQTAPPEAAFTASSPWPNLIYTWYEGDRGNTAVKIRTDTNVASSTFKPSRLQAATVWVRVTSGCGTTWDSPTLRVATSAACTPIEFLAQPQGAEIAAGAEHTMTWQTTAVPVTNAQWWYRATVGEIIGASERSKTVRPRISARYHVVAEATGCHKARSADAFVKVTSCDLITVNQPPLSQTILKGQSVTLSVTATPVNSSYGALSYQWFKGEPGEPGVPFAYTASILETPTVDTKYWVRIILGDPLAGGCAIDKSATVTVCDPPVINVDPMGSIKPAGFKHWIGVAATGTNLVYQWYIGPQGDTSSPINTAVMSELLVSPTQTTDYWVRVTNSCGEARSTAAKVSIPPVISSTLTGGAVTKNSTRTLTVSASGTQLRYQWYRGTDDTQPVAGQTSPSFTTPAFTADVTYWARVWSGDAYADTNSATFTVCQPRGIVMTQPSKVSGSQVTLRVDFPDANESYEWYEGQTGVTTKLLNTGTQVVVSPTVTTSYWMRTKRSTCDADTATWVVAVCFPNITTQPTSLMIDPGTTTTLSVVASGDPTMTYQWYEGAAGDTSLPLSGKTQATFTTPALTTQKSYWVAVTNAPNASCTSRTTNSTAAVVSICQPPTITADPLSGARTTSALFPLSVSASGTNLTYQWYQGASGTTTTPVAGATTASINVGPTVTTNYWVRVTGRCGTKDSAAAKVSVPPSITTQPASASITKGTTKTLTVVASGTELTYQWYDANSNPISGATSASYTTPVINGDTSYWVRVYSGATSVNSSVATLTVCLPRGIVVTQSSTVTGSQVALQIDAPASGETYEWYRGASGNTSSPAGTGQLIYDSPAQTTQYWVRTKRSSCDADSAAVTVSICYPKITANPVNVGITAGQTATFSVTATGPSPLAYQWFNADTNAAIGGATSSSYTTGALSSTLRVYARVTAPVTGSCTNTYVNSTTATATVCNPVAITQQPINNNILRTQSVTLTVQASGNVTSYQWYEGAAGVTTTPVGTNSATLTLIPQTTKSYWVRVSGSCGNADSAAALQSVVPEFTTQPTDKTACANSSVTFNAEAWGSASTVTYQWYRQLSGGSPEPVGTNAKTLTITATGAMTIWCNAVSGNTSASSTHVALSVTPAPQIIGLSFTRRAGGSFTLYSSVADPDDASYEWFEGPLGTTTLLVGNSYYANVYPSSVPKKYWVRVTSLSTGCSSSAEITVQ